MSPINSASWIAYIKTFIVIEDKYITGLIYFSILLSLYYSGKTGINKYIEPL